MLLSRWQRRMIGSALLAIGLLSGRASWAQTQPANPSFSSTADVNVLNPPLTQFGTFRQDNAGTTLNLSVFNLPATTGTTSPMSLAHYPPLSNGDSAAISLQTANIVGLQPVASGTPSAPMQLVVSTSQAGNFQVSYQLEFASDSLPAALHQSIVIAAYATVLRHGDFNADGKVDSGDYVIWRKTNGQSVTPFTRADDNGDGIVNTMDYSAWRAAYSGPLGTGSSEFLSSGQIPEPSAPLLSIVGVLFASAQRVRRRVRS